MKLLIAIALFAAASGCSATVTRNPVPLDLQDHARIPGIPTARYWLDAAPKNIGALVEEAIAQRRAAGIERDVTMMALSGGADDGAFGAGLMRGWTELGTRPEFTIVTGVSTGALLAPFVFLGSEYDEVLAEIYGGYPPERIYQTRPWLNILPSASLVDTSPLFELIQEYANEELLATVAREHLRGRRLYVQSVNLDAQRPVLWDLGAIAASEAPNALDVFRKALLASASIPVGFPPVIFEVEVDGATFDEMHVDGGVMSQNTVLLAWQSALKKQFARSNERESTRFYVVRNAPVEPTPELIEHGILDIAERSISTLIYSQGIANLILSYDAARLRGADFYVTWIGSDFDAPHPEPFDQSYMRALSEYGYEKALAGEAWRRRPPRMLDENDVRVAAGG